MMHAGWLDGTDGTRGSRVSETRPYGPALVPSGTTGLAIPGRAACLPALDFTDSQTLVPDLPPVRTRFGSVRLRAYVLL